MQKPWSINERMVLKEFLKKNPRFMLMLRGSLPKSEGDTLEKMALTASKRSGGEEMLSLIESLSQDVDPESTETPYLAP